MFIFFNEPCFVFFALLVLLTLSLSQSRYETDVNILRTISSLEKVVGFYVDNIDKVNVDSIFGLRVAEGGLENILEKLHQVGEPKPPYFTRLNSLHKAARSAAEKSLPYLEEYQSDYYYDFKPTVQRSWTWFKDFKRLESFPYKALRSLTNASMHPNGKNFNENISDRCMTEIMGTTRGRKHPCFVSQGCLRLMLSNKLKRYGNTHQVIYFLLGYRSGCLNILEREFAKLSDYAGDKDLESFLEKKCRKIFDEMKELEPNVVFNGDIDLFLEQGLVCAILGYEDFLSLDTLHKMFSWQSSEHGCFGTEMIKTPIGKEKLNAVHDYDAKWLISSVTMRKLLYDRPLENRCSPHETGVAAGLLSIYLRWLIFTNAH